LLLLGCNQPTKPTEQSSKLSAKSIDTSKYVILKFDPDKDKYIFGKDNKPADLSADEIVKIETMIADEVARYNKNAKATEDSISKTNGRNKYEDSSAYYQISDPGKYYKQFVTVTDAKGQKEVWVGCFCDKYFWHMNWQKSLVMIDGGGDCYFQFRINLTTIV
jgi:hypothetical protein